MKLHLVIATLGWDGYQECIRSLQNTAETTFVTHVIFDRTIIEAYNEGAKTNMGDIVGYVHDDVKIYEQGWDKRVLKEFEDPKVGLVGFGGATGLGHPQIYQIPYQLVQLARFHFRSNMRDAEVHGERFVGECDVACLDGFAIFVRRNILKAMGYWPVGTPIGYFMYDNYLACEVYRQGYRARLVGIDCEHLGGKSSTLRALPDDHAKTHEWFYEHFRGILPIHVNQ